MRDFCFLIEKDEREEGLVIKYPEDDPVEGASKLADLAEYTRALSGNNWGSLRNTFLGTTNWKLYKFGFHDDMVLELVFRDRIDKRFTERIRIRSERFKMIVIEGKSARVIVGQ
ncbi:hypothetical protein IKE71_04000 [Candidatus Saccharibacteria bacterium]|nr:hypothetical protein [Candidatus Saccharibacteria bacterium]